MGEAGHRPKHGGLVSDRDDQPAGTIATSNVELALRRFDLQDELDSIPKWIPFFSIWIIGLFIYGISIIRRGVLLYGWSNSLIISLAFLLHSLGVVLWITTPQLLRGRRLRRKLKNLPVLPADVGRG